MIMEGLRKLSDRARELLATETWWLVKARRIESKHCEHGRIRHIMIWRILEEGRTTSYWGIYYLAIHTAKTLLYGWHGHTPRLEVSGLYVWLWQLNINRAPSWTKLKTPTFFWAWQPAIQISPRSLSLEGGYTVNFISKLSRLRTCFPSNAGSNLSLILVVV
jgi:hypothetical protein